MANERPPFVASSGEPDAARLIDLYKYYEGVGSQARAQMMTAANWLLTFATGLLVYAVRQTLTLGPGWTACARNTEEPVLVAAVGIAFCTLTIATVQQFEAHVHRNWFRATRCKHLVPDLYLLVAEAGATAPRWDEQEGWPPNLRDYKRFRIEASALSRGAFIFKVYWGFVAALLLAFALILLVALMRPACPPATAVVPALTAATSI